MPQLWSSEELYFGLVVASAWFCDDVVGCCSSLTIFSLIIEFPNLWLFLSSDVKKLRNFSMFWNCFIYFLFFFSFLSSWFIFEGWHFVETTKLYSRLEQFYRGHSKMTSTQKCQILDPPPPLMSPLVTFFIIPPPPDLTRQIVTDLIFLNQRP